MRCDAMRRKLSGVGTSVIVVRACLLALVLAGLGRVQPAVAADGPQSVTFGCLGIPQYFNVPPGVTGITVHAEGAAGGSQGGSGGPGKGAIVTATLTVVPGHTLEIDVGCRGVSGFSATQDGGQGGYGYARGGNGGQNSGTSAAGVGGGGATGIIDLGDVTNQSQVTSPCDAGGGGGSFGGDVLLVAAGGGGGGGDSGVLVSCEGGGGGDGGSTGGGGGTGICFGAGGGGGLGTATDAAGGNGGFGTAGGGGGGGGGGGYPKGGGGGNGGGLGGGGGGGGGGGLNYSNPAVASGVSQAVASSATDGTVTISYTGPSGTPQRLECSGSQTSYVVPDGVTRLLVTAVGADGGSAAGASGGQGGGISGQIAVTPGETLLVDVGCRGQHGIQGDPFNINSPTMSPSAAGGFGFFPGGSGGKSNFAAFVIGAGREGGGGGGGSTGILGSAPARLIVGAGGGGAGGPGSFGAGGGGGDGDVDNASGGSGLGSGDRGGLGTGGLVGGAPGGSASEGTIAGGGGGGGGGRPAGGGGGAGGAGGGGGGGGGGGKSFAGSSTGPSPDVTGAVCVDTSDYPQADGVLTITPVFAAPVDANIQITPATATNAVGTNHTLTITVNTSGGMIAAGGGTATATITSGPGSFVGGNTCTYSGGSASASCTVVITSATAGTTAVSATSNIPVDGDGSLSRTTDGTAGSSGPAQMNWVDANIQIAPATATNPVGTNHTVTITVNTSGGTIAAGGGTATASIASGPGSFVGGNTCTYLGGGASASCTVVITSATAGTTKVSATSSIPLAGDGSLSRTTDGTGGNSGQAQKNWVDANIQIAPATATNEIRTNHTLTITVNASGGTIAAGGGTATASIASGPGSFVGANTCTYTGGSASASCTVVITSATVGTTKVSATSSIPLAGAGSLSRTTDGTGSNSSPAEKTWVDANIQIAPATATNAAGTNHTLTITVNTSGGTIAAGGGTATATISSGPGSFVGGNTCTYPGGGASASCTVVITSATAGTTEIKASTTVSVGGASLTRDTDGSGANSGPATKLWADDVVTTTVRNSAGNDITGQAVPAGTVVHDEATVSKAAGTPASVPDPTGTVDFTLYDNGTCDGNVVATDPGKPLVGGVATSADFTTTTGTFSYRAHFNGQPGVYPAHDGPCEAFEAGKHLTYGGSMEGALKFQPGAWVNGGYHFKLAQKNTSPVTVHVTGVINVPVHCGSAKGPLAAGSPIAIPVSIAPFTIPAGSTSWYLTGDQKNILGWMGSVQAPDLCGGGQTMYNSEGATFDVIVVSGAHTGGINFQWHYRIPAAKGKPDTNCLNASDPNRNRSDVCSASWSSTKDP